MLPTTQTTPTWPPAGWITKKTAAERLKLTKERIAGLVREEKVHSRKERDPAINQVVTLLHEGDVERFLHQRNNPQQEVVATPNRPNSPKQLPAPETPVSIKIDERAPNWNPHCWPAWLTLQQAAEYFGLPRRWLLELAATSNQPAGIAHGIIFIDVGRHSPGGRWRFRRERLD